MYLLSRQVKDFPAQLTTTDEVVDIVTKMIWLLSVKHAAVNYPVADYGGFTPILPTKVYNDTRVPPGVSSVFNLANVNISVVSVTDQAKEHAWGVIGSCSDLHPLISLDSFKTQLYCF